MGVLYRYFTPTSFSNCRIDIREKKLKSRLATTHIGDTYASQKFPIENEEIVAVDGYIQVVNLQNEILFCEEHQFIVSNPECELLDISNQFRFLNKIKVQNSWIMDYCLHLVGSPCVHKNFGEILSRGKRRVSVIQYLDLAACVKKSSIARAMKLTYSHRWWYDSITHYVCVTHKSDLLNSSRKWVRCIKSCLH